MKEDHANEFRNLIAHQTNKKDFCIDRIMYGGKKEKVEKQKPNEEEVMKIPKVVQ